MALVAYDCSDDSDCNDEDELNDAQKNEVILKKPENVSDTASVPETADEIVANGLFKLPPAQNNNSNDSDEESDSEDDEPYEVPFSRVRKPNFYTLSADENKLKSTKFEFLKKLVPISSTKESSVTKKHVRKKTEAESGLLTMLPSPSNKSTSVFENALSNPKLLPTAVKNKLTEQTKTKTSRAVKKDDDDDDGDTDTDFFNLSEVDKIDENIVTADIDLFELDPPEELKVKAPGASFPATNSFSSVSGTNLLPSNADASVIESDVNTNVASQLDEDAMLKLCGRKRKGQFPDDIQVIDIREDAILAETRKNLTKNLTEETDYRPSSKKFGGPSSLSKRKHQITYLAFQAKERELELKNQWANNRFSRKQTQSKYGF